MPAVKNKVLPGGGAEPWPPGRGGSVVNWLLAAAVPAVLYPPAVRQAATGHYWLLLGLWAAIICLAAPFILAGKLRRAAWCRVVPDPETADLRPVPRALAAAMAEARLSGRQVEVDLLPLYDAGGCCRPYRVVLVPPGCRFRLGAGEVFPAAPPVPLPAGTRLRAPAWFSVGGHGGARLVIAPEEEGQKLAIWHDAVPFRAGLAGLFPGLLRVAAPAFVLWSIGGHGAYAGINPALPAWMLLVAAVRYLPLALAAGVR